MRQAPYPPGNSLNYLATPYSEFKGGIDAAFEAAGELAGHLLRAGINVFSPITHSHPIATFGGIDHLDYSIWLPFDEYMMAKCDGLIVAEMEGWTESKGIAHEIRYFERAAKPIWHLIPRTLTFVRRRYQSAPAPGDPHKQDGIERARAGAVSEQWIPIGDIA